MFSFLEEKLTISGLLSRLLQGTKTGYGCLLQLISHLSNLYRSEQHFQNE